MDVLGIPYNDITQAPRAMTTTGPLALITKLGDNLTTLKALKGRTAKPSPKPPGYNDDGSASPRPQKPQDEINNAAPPTLQRKDGDNVTQSPKAATSTTMTVPLTQAAIHLLVSCTVRAQAPI